MIIGIDANDANRVERVGVHQYAYELLWALYNLAEKERKGHLFILYLKNNPAQDLPPEKSNWKYRILPGSKLWILTKLTPHLYFHKDIDVFFSPNHYLPPVFNVPKIFTVHDLGYLRFSEQFKPFDFWQLRVWTAISVSISKYIIAVSQSTRQDIVRHYKFASDKIQLIYHGVNGKQFHPKYTINDVRRLKEKYKIDGDYILFVGTLKPSKNVTGIIRAFKILTDKKYRITLVIAGKKGWLYEDVFKYISNNGLEERVVFTDYVKNSDKPILMAGAKVLLSPSFWEGFGMHILESLAVGTPVVASKEGGIPEICGKACTYIDPKDVENIAMSITKYLNMGKNEYNIEKLRAVKQAEKFKWLDTAKQTLKLLEKSRK